MALSSTAVGLHRLAARARLAAKRAFTVLSALCYAVFLQLIYVFEISPGFAYAGYVYRPISELDSVLVTLLATAPAVWLPVRLARPSQVMYWLLYVVAYVPSVLVPIYATSLAPGVVMRYSVALLLAFALLGAVYILPPLYLRRITIDTRVFWTAFCALTLAAIAAIVTAFGVPDSLPALGAIYEVREEYSAGLEAGGRILSLSVAWLVNFAGPLLLAIGFTSGRKLFIVAGVGVELMVFATTGFKSALLAPIALLGVFLLVRFGSRVFGALMSIGILVLMAFAWLVSTFSGQIVFMSWLVRRFLVTPGLAAGRFYEFFSENQFAWLGHSVLAGFVETPYDLTPPYLVGLAYEERLFSNNANFWADGYANAGFLGLFLATIVVAVLIYVYDSTARHRLKRYREVLVLLFVMPSVTLSNSAVLTTLATHGMALVVLVALLVPPQSLLPHFTSRTKRPLKLSWRVAGPRLPAGDPT